MNTIKIIIIAILFLNITLLTYSNDINKTNYQTLDSNIVKAYNSTPRNTLKVYENSILILNKSEKDTTTSGKAWKLKAEKLITVSCFYECTKSIDNKLYRQAYIWAMRGVKRGTTFGKIGDTSLKNLYKYLKYTGSELQKTPMVKNSNQANLLWQIDNFQDPSTDKQLQPANAKGKLLKTQLSKEPYKLIEGPAVGVDGIIFVKITVNNSEEITIKEYNPKEWQTKILSGYYSSWKKCAYAVYKQAVTRN